MIFKLYIWFAINGKALLELGTFKSCALCFCNNIIWDAFNTGRIYGHFPHCNICSNFVRNSSQIVAMQVYNK